MNMLLNKLMKYLVRTNSDDLRKIEFEKISFEKINQNVMFSNYELHCLVEGCEVHCDFLEQTELTNEYRSYIKLKKHYYIIDWAEVHSDDPDDEWIDIEFRSQPIEIVDKLQIIKLEFLKNQN